MISRARVRFFALRSKQRRRGDLWVGRPALRTVPANGKQSGPQGWRAALVQASEPPAWAGGWILLPARQTGEFSR